MHRPSILTRRLCETRTFSTPRRWTRHWPVEHFRDWGGHSGLMASHDAHQMCRSRTFVCTCTMYIYIYIMYYGVNIFIYRIYIVCIISITYINFYMIIGIYGCLRLRPGPHLRMALGRHGTQHTTDAWITRCKQLFWYSSHQNDGFLSKWVVSPDALNVWNIYYVHLS